MIGERTLVAGVLLVVPLALLVVGRSGEFTQLAAFSPMFFPNLVLWCWAGVATLSLIGEIVALRKRALPDDDSVASVGTPVLLRLVLIIAAMGAFVFALRELGFFLSGVAFALFSLYVLGIRGRALWLGFGVGLPLTLFILFHHLLGLPLPTSPFTYLF